MTDDRILVKAEWTPIMGMEDVHAVRKTFSDGTTETENMEREAFEAFVKNLRTGGGA